ncbi:MAG: site-specific DNA-methyltransferase [Planctomycetota bacterium]
MAGKRNQIIRGDCIEQLGRLDADCVDLAFADPPFNIGYKYDEYDDDRSCDEYLDWSKRWMSAVVRAMRMWGAFWLAIGDEYAAELKVIATRELGLTCRSWVVWYYTFGVNCTSKFTRSHAHLFYFLKPGRGSAKHGATFNDAAIRVPSARQLVYADARANPKGRLPDDTWIMQPADCQLPISDCRSEETQAGDSRRRAGRRSMGNRISEIGNPSAPQAPTTDGFILRPQDIPDSFSADSDTWYFPRVCGTFKQRQGFHGCQMPEQLLGRIIKACSNEGDLVLDPFAGSGTTLAVAGKLGRDYLGYDISDEYVKQVSQRLAAIRRGDALEGDADPLKSAPDTANGKVRTEDGRRVRKSTRRTRPAEATLFECDSDQQANRVLPAKGAGR